MSFFPKKNSTLLIKRDTLYKNVISKLSVSNRITYCESLLYRTEKDLSFSTCSITKKRLKKLVEATKIEVKNLKRM